MLAAVRLGPKLGHDEAALVTKPTQLSDALGPAKAQKKEQRPTHTQVSNLLRSQERYETEQCLNSMQPGKNIKTILYIPID